jgi:hypothetical protein
MPGESLAPLRTAPAAVTPHSLFPLRGRGGRREEPADDRFRGGIGEPGTGRGVGVRDGRGIGERPALRERGSGGRAAVADGGRDARRQRRARAVRGACTTLTALCDGNVASTRGRRSRATLPWPPDPSRQPASSPRCPPFTSGEPAAHARSPHRPIATRDARRPISHPAAPARLNRPSASRPVPCRAPSCQEPLASAGRLPSIRRYRPGDRAAVHQICLRTGDAGEAGALAAAVRDLPSRAGRGAHHARRAGARRAARA